MRIMAAIKMYTDENAAQEREIDGPLEEDPEYQLIVETNELSTEIDNEIMLIHKFIRDIYAKKFPELENLIQNPVDYAKVVKGIGNEMDLTMVNLDDLMPSSTVMVVSVTGSTTNGKPLSDEDLQSCMEGCDEMLSLFDDRMEMLGYVESRMEKFAPNVSALIGAHLSARMIGLAGGLTALSKIPSCNVQALGTSRKMLNGLANKAANGGAGVGANNGLLAGCEIVTTAPNHLKHKALRLVAGKVTLAARVDSFHQFTDGNQGERLRTEVLSRIDQLQEPPPPKQAKALPIPGEGRKKKRGGKRYRKMKEQYAMTDARKLQNRMVFGKISDDDLEGKNMGMLGMKSGNGRVRMAADSKKMMKAIKKQQKQNSHTSGAASGLSSSLAFTPVQGLELENPNANAFKQKSGSKYFSTNSGFRSVGPKIHTPATDV